MKCTITGEQFKQLVSKSGKTGNILLFHADKEHHLLRIQANTIESWTEASAAAAIDQDGKVVVPIKPLSALAMYVRPQDTLLLEKKEKILKITTKQGKTAIHGHEVEHFTPFPSLSHQPLFQAPASAFFPACRRALVSAARSTLKPELASVLLRFDGDTLILASTDGFRLTEERLARTIFSLYPPETRDILVPYRSLEEIIRVFEEGSEEISGSTAEGTLLVSSPSARLLVRTTEGSFPQYDQIIPKQFTVSCTVARDQIQEVLRQASIFSGKLYDIRLSYTSKTNELFIHTFNQEVGEFSSALAASGSGDDCEIVCNWRYFLDGVAGFSGDHLTLSFTNESSPLVMRDPQRAHGFYLLMPMRGV